MLGFGARVLFVQVSRGDRQNDKMQVKGVEERKEREERRGACEMIVDGERGRQK